MKEKCKGGLGEVGRGGGLEGGGEGLEWVIVENIKGCMR